MLVQKVGVRVHEAGGELPDGEGGAAGGRQLYITQGL